MDESLYSPAGSQREYLARIHRVMDYIEANLERELTLDELARVACFSRFHFHRIFKAITSESLYQFILRLRLEKAASQLIQNPGKSVTEVALDCGFSSSATFARAFRAFFSVSASEWKKRCGKQYEPRTEGVIDSDDCGGKKLKPGVPMKEALSVRVENLSPMSVAYVRHVGPYAGNSALFESLFGKLCRWAGPRGFLGGPSSKLLAVYHDSPEITEEDKLRLSVCVTVPPATVADGEIGIMEIAGGKYVRAFFELDSSEYGAAWNWVFGKWMFESGYQPEGFSCFESYLNDPQQHPQHKCQVEICVAVRPL